MSCNCSHSTVGIIIGSSYILGAIIFVVLTAVYKYNLDFMDRGPKRLNEAEDMRTIFMTLLTILVSGLFIVAILKRFYYLILPWLVLVIFVFYESCKFMFKGFISEALDTTSEVLYLISILTIVAAVLTIQIAIFGFSCILLNDIRKGINTKPKSLPNDHQNEPTEYTAMTEKSMI